MASTFTTNKSIEKPAHGDYNNDWDIPLNADMDDIDAALGGTSTINVSGLPTGAYALSLAQYRTPNIEFFGTIGAGVILNFYTPVGVGGIWTILNNTTGAVGPLSILSAGGGPGVIAIPRNQRVLVVSEGVSFAFAQSPGTSANPSSFAGLAPVNGTATTFMTSDSAPALSQAINPIWTGQHSFNGQVFMANLVTAVLTVGISGGAGAQIDMRAGSLLTPTLSPGDSSTHAASTAFVATSFAPLASPVLSGAPTSPTASVGTANNQIATTSFTNPSSGSNGNGHWRENPDGTWMMWGIAASQAGAPGLFVTFPVSFPNACDSVIALPYSSNSSSFTGAYTDGGAHQTSTTGFWLLNAISANCYWIAMGH